MNQQINLYQPIFREERKLFSLQTASIALGLVSVGLIAMWMLGAHNVHRLANNVAQLKQQLAAQERMAQSAGLVLDAHGNAQTAQEQVRQLSARLAEHTRALDLLRNGAAGEPTGFAARLEAFAHQHTDGVWLDHLFLGGNGVGVSLQGRSIDADLVPKYLQSLTAEPELAGTRFDEVVLDRREHRDEEAAALAQPNGIARKPNDNSPTVRFSVSSSALLNSLFHKEPGQDSSGSSSAVSGSSAVGGGTSGRGL